MSNLNRLAGVASAVVIAAAPARAAAEELIKFIPSGPAEKYIGWVSADPTYPAGTNPIKAAIKRVVGDDFDADDAMTVKGPQGYPVTMKFRCPIGWNPETVTETPDVTAKAGIHTGEVANTSILQTGETGVFAVRTTMPAVSGEMETSVACVRKEGETERDRHELTAKLISNGGEDSGESPSGFYHRTDDEDREPMGDGQVQVFAGVGFPNLGAQVGANVDMFPRSRWGHTRVGGQVGWQRNNSSVILPSGATEEMDADVIAVQATGAWSPALIRNMVRGHLGLGGGICRVLAGETSDGGPVPFVTTGCVTGEVGVGIGNNDYGVTVGGQITLSPSKDVESGDFFLRLNH